MNKKILIVGGAGYIGGFLTDQLSKLYNVTVYDSLMYETRFLKKVNFINGDIRDYNKLQKILNDYDVVIWLAAIVGDGACTIDPLVTQEINSDSVKWLVHNFKGKIIFTSTCSVYGMNDELLDENSPTNPLSIYASTKLDAEQYIINNCDNYLIFRLGTLFGMGDEYSRIRLDLVTNVLTYKATKKETLTVFGGEQWRPLLHVKDVSTAINYGLENITGLYNLSYKNFTIREIADTIQEIIPNTSIKYTELPFEDMRNYKVKNEKYLSTGWLPEYNINIGIKEMIKIINEERIVNIEDPIYHNHFYLKSIWKQK